MTLVFINPMYLQCLCLNLITLDLFITYKGQFPCHIVASATIYFRIRLKVRVRVRVHQVNMSMGLHLCRQMRNQNPGVH